MQIFWGWLLRIPPPSRSNLESVMCSSSTPPPCRCRAGLKLAPDLRHDMKSHKWLELCRQWWWLVLIMANFMCENMCTPQAVIYVYIWAVLALLMSFQKKYQQSAYAYVQFVFFLSLDFCTADCCTSLLSICNSTWWTKLQLIWFFYSLVLGGGGGRLTLCGLFLVSNQLEMDGSLSPSLWALQIHIHKSYCVKWPI